MSNKDVVTHLLNRLPEDVSLEQMLAKSNSLRESEKDSKSSTEVKA
jgi:hypothetical protein